MKRQTFQLNRPTRPRFSFLLCCLLFITLSGISLGANDPLDEGWMNPPIDARLRAYWWWPNGNVTAEAITRDLEEMKVKGFGGAVITDADGSSQDGNERAPHGPTFLSPQWRELYKHTLREAERLGLEMSLNIQSGWNLGGPMVKPEDAAKKLTWSELGIKGPAAIQQSLPTPQARDNFYRDLFVVAYRQGNASLRPLQNWEQKAVHKTLVPFSAPDSTPLFREYPDLPDQIDAQSSQVVDLTTRLKPDGTLIWDAPEGDWRILRFGCTIGDHSRVSTCSQGWDGYALDVLDAGAFIRYWDTVVDPLISDAGALAGKTLKYLHTDSWEVEAINWTPTLREEFQKRNGYNLLPYAPALVGRIVNSRAESNRFLHDFRKTLGDLAIDNHYRIFRDRAHQHGLLIHPESGGPHAVPIDAQRCLGFVDAPMSEFWAWSWRHRIGDDNRFFVKQPASAAHTYGRKLVLGEGFTTIGPHWQETLRDNLKPSFDKAACEGLNLLVWHAFVCSPAEMGIPGQQYFAGTHLNPNVTWWSHSAPVFDYFNRCQWMLQQGRFAADVCYYYGDHVPNFTQHKLTDPARILPGYDYDVITEEAILTRMTVREGRLILPDGMNYRIMVLPDRRIISLPVLRKLKELVHAGGVVIGPKPNQASTLRDFPRCDDEVKTLAEQLWGKDQESPGENRFGRGRVIWGKTARAVLLADRIKPDFETEGSAPDAVIDYIHRINGDTDLYFVANRNNRGETVRCNFRIAGRAPELWDPVTGDRRFAVAYSQVDGRTTVPLEFTPCGSVFVVFRAGAEKHPSSTDRNSPQFTTYQPIAGPWIVTFDTEWGGPESVQFDSLVSWTTQAELGIKYFSGKATYLKSFDLPSGQKQPGRLWLDLGNL
ncbi:MAG: glycoside hydrolase, partial [Phycisphaerae bacterium]|nr:glycoside hydrolase [Phycisphaerae bacterium]